MRHEMSLTLHNRLLPLRSGYHSRNHSLHIVHKSMIRIFNNRNKINDFPFLCLVPFLMNALYNTKHLRQATPSTIQWKISRPVKLRDQQSRMRHRRFQFHRWKFRNLLDRLYRIPTCNTTQKWLHHLGKSDVSHFPK